RRRIRGVADPVCERQRSQPDNPQPWSRCMGRGSNSASKRAREAERDRKKQEKQERARQRRADSPGGIEVASVEEIQTAAVHATVTGINANGHVVTGDELEGGASGPPCRLFVGGLSWDTTAAELRKLFGDVGEVVDAV